MNYYPDSTDWRIVAGIVMILVAIAIAVIVGQTLIALISAVLDIVRVMISAVPAVAILAVAGGVIWLISQVKPRQSSRMSHTNKIVETSSTGPTSGPKVVNNYYVRGGSGLFGWLFAPFGWISGTIKTAIVIMALLFLYSVSGPIYSTYLTAKQIYQNPTSVLQPMIPKLPEVHLPFSDPGQGENQP